MRATLVALALAGGERVFFLPLDGRADFPGEEALRKIKPILENPTLKKNGYNLKFCSIPLARRGIKLAGVNFDIMVASYILNPSQKVHSLAGIAFDRLGVELPDWRELLGSGRQALTPAQIPLPQLAGFSCREAEIAQSLVRGLEGELKDKELYELFCNLEMPLVSVLADMELAGVAIDTALLERMGQELGERVSELEEEIYYLVGHEFNINSPKQLEAVLFKDLALPKIRKTKTGYSTDAGVLEELRLQHPVIEKILDFRNIQKLKSTYVDALPALVNPQTGRVHTSFNQTVTATGRLSSSDPNLQNIPIKGELGARIRQAFVAEDDNFLLAADYSQVELRIIAHVTQDEGLLAAFKSGEDIHTATAAQVLGLSAEEVTGDMRRLAKMINFGIAYGMSDFGLAQGLGISRTEAREFIAGYFTRFPAIAHYITTVKAQVLDQGYVSTLLGRRRYIPEITSSHPAVRSAAERMAINMPIQGTAADIIKLAMIRLHQSFKERGLSGKMVLQVHDELVFEVPPAEVESVVGLVRTTMETALPLSVPLKVDLHIGKNWNQMEPVK